MKKILLLAITLWGFGNQFAFAQCNAASYNWGDATYGVSPNPSLGETFNVGVVGEAYSDVIYVLAPVLASDINTSLPATPIDSVKVDGISLFNGSADVNLSTLGLTLICNNQGDCADPCMFLGGHAYCGDITGIPNTAGTFPVKINVTVYGNFGFVNAIPYQFENYSLTILGTNSISVTHLNGDVLLNQNSPNPADASTLISFELPLSVETKLIVQNLIGEKVFEKKLQGKRGENAYRLDTSLFPNGIYLYNIQAGDKKITRRMVVQH